MSSKTTIKKSFSFYSKELNSHKKYLLHKKAEELRDFRNQISQEVCLDLPKFEKMSKFDWINHFRTRLPNCNSTDIGCTIADVFVNYQNKINSFRQKISFKLQKSLGIRYYKKNHKQHKKGDFHSHDMTFRYTKLTKVVTYLARYYNDGMFNWLKENKDLDEKKSLT